jgi:hypothetical protein
MERIPFDPTVALSSPIDVPAVLPPVPESGGVREVPVEAPTAQSASLKNKGGRPKKYISNAAKQQAARKRTARKHGRKFTPKCSHGIQEPTQLPPVAPTRSKEDAPHDWVIYRQDLIAYKELWDKYLEKVGLGLGQGKFLRDAPRGKGKLVSGGYDSKKIMQVDAAGQFNKGTEGYPARPSRPQGNGPDGMKDMDAGLGFEEADK